MAVATFGNNIVGAFTGGIPVTAIYAGSTKVWPMSGPGPGPEPSFYYVSWQKAPNSTFSYMDFGYFILDGVQYSVNSFLSGYFSGFGGVIDESAFYNNFHLSVMDSDDMRALIRFETNAFKTSSYALAQTVTLKRAYLSNCKYVGDRTFYGCTLLSSISLPVCSYIGEGAFFNCGVLSYINFPSVEYVGQSAFYSCSSLQTIVLPSCTYVSDMAFEYCDGFNTLNLPKCSYIGVGAFRNCDRIKTVSLPACKHVDSQAFMGNGGNFISSLYLPECISIGYSGFANRNGISSVNLPKCKFIDNAAFVQCSIQTLSIPEVEYIGDYAFEHNYISNFWGGYSFIMDIPKCSYIGTEAFWGGAALFGELNAPKCKTIGSHAFVSARISSMNLAECEYIGHYAFESCSRLSSVYLPKCSSLGGGVFYDCSSLTTLTLGYSGVCSYNSSISTHELLTGTPIGFGNGSILVPASLVTAYKNTSGWSRYSSVIFSIPS